MKKIALISSFCDTEEKIRVLSENLTILKSLGLDTFVISPLNLPKEIIEKSDFVFFTKENPVLVWPDRAFTFWKTSHTKDCWIMMHHNVADYGWAGLYQIKKMTQFALSYDYDIFYHMIYDLDIDETVLEEIKTNVVNRIHPRVNPNKPDDIWEATLHFMIFDREKMIEVEKRINYHDYLIKDGVAEGEALKWAKELPLEISKIPVRDKIYFWGERDFFNYNKEEGFKYFISKNEPTTVLERPENDNLITTNLKIFFYDFTSEKEIKVLINGKEFLLKLNENFLFDSGFPYADVVQFQLNYDGKMIDMMETYKKISRNLLYSF